MLSLVISISISVCVVLIFRFINTEYKPAILGIYQQENKTYWLKFLFMYTVLRYRQFKTYISRLLAVEFGRSADGTAHIQEHDEKLEKLYDLGQYTKSVDGAYFNGMSKRGDVIVCGVARRPNNMCDAFMYLKVHDQDLLLSPALPDTCLKQEPEDENLHRVQGISMYNFIPMRTWKLSYNREMKIRNEPDKKVKVDANLTWSANWAPFEYDIEMSPRSMAADMAREPWSRDYFKLLQKLHQTHYEQMGHLTGLITIDGKKYNLNMPCVRDRTCATLREWRNFHRYVIHFIFLDNGDCIVVGSVSQPSILSHLTIGYVCRKADQTVVPVSYSDYKLYQHGENYILPKNYGFIFKAGGMSYEIQVEVFDEDSFYIGKDREAKLYERWSKVVINGVKGLACVECHYNNTCGTL